MTLLPKYFTKTLQKHKQYIGYTNRVLYLNKTNKVLHLNKKNNEVEYFLPAYLRLVVKKISEFNYSQSKAKIMATLILTVCYDYLQGMAYDQLEYLLINNMTIDINGELIQLNQSNEKVFIYINNPLPHFISYTYQNQIQIGLSSAVFLTPFEKIYGEFHVSLNTIQRITIPLQSQQIKQKSNSKQHIARIKFNLMDDIKNPIQKRFQYKNQRNEIGYFKLKTGNRGVQYYEKQYTKFQLSINFLKNTNFENEKCERIVQSINRKNGNLHEGKIKNWQNAMFKLQFTRRRPFIQLITLMVPLWILSLLNLPIFFQELNLVARIPQIAGILLALFAYLPTIRQRIGSSSSSTLTLIQVNVYFLISTCLLCLFKSYIAYKADPDGKNLNYVWKQDIFFIICLIIISISIVIFVFLYFLYLLFGTKQFRDNKQKFVEETKSNLFLKKSDWFNIECDYEFKNNSNIHSENQLLKQRGVQQKYSNNQQQYKRVKKIKQVQIDMKKKEKEE